MSDLGNSTVYVSEIGYRVGAIEDAVWKGHRTDPYVVLGLAPSSSGYRMNPETARRMARALIRWANAADPPKRRR